MAVSKDIVAALYVAMFSRAPEGEGLESWYKAATENNWTVDQLAEAMLQAAQQVVSSNEKYVEIYPQYVNVDPTNPESVRKIIATVYENVLGKGYDDDPQGIDGWVNAVVNGQMTIGGAVAGIIDVALNHDWSDNPEAQKAVETLKNRIEVAKFFAEHVKEFDGDFKKYQQIITMVTDDPSTVEQAKLKVYEFLPLEFTASASTKVVQEGETVEITIKANHPVAKDTVLYYEIKGDTKGETVEAANPADDLGKVIGKVVIPAGESSATITLTAIDDKKIEGLEGFNVQILDSNMEVVASSGPIVIMDDPNAGREFVLTRSSVSGEFDNFVGTEGNDIFRALAFNSLEDGDVLDGKGGEDILEARFDTSSSSLTVTPDVQNIEKIYLTLAKGGNNLTYDFTSTSGVKEVYVTDLDASQQDTITLDNVSKEVVVGVRKGVSNNTDNLAVNFTNSNGSNDEVTFAIKDAGKVNTLTIPNIETLNLTAEGEGNKISALTAAAAKTLNIAGSGKVEIDNLSGSTSLDTIDASANSGGVTLGSLSNTIPNWVTTVKGGSGDDKFFMSQGNISATDKIDAGEGTDVIILTGGSASKLSALKNFEVLAIGDNLANNSSDTLTYNLDHFTNSNIGTVRIVKGGDDNDANNDTITISNISGQTVEVVDSVVKNSGGGTATLRLQAKNSGANLTLNLQVGANTNNGVDIELLEFNDNVSSVTINVTDPDNKLSSGQTNDIKIKNVSTVTLNATSPVNLAFDNSGNHDTKTVDASASTADVDVDGTNGYADSTTHEGMTIKTGSGNDTVKGTDENDVIETGAGDDTIDNTGANNDGGDDTIKAGAGDDTIKVAVSAFDKNDKIDGGEGRDTLEFNGSIDLSGANAAKLQGISNIEVIAIDGSAGGKTLTIDDATLSATNNDLTISVHGDSDNTSDANTVDASGVVLSTGKITLDLSQEDGYSASNNPDTITYKVGNAQETVIGGNGNDTFEVSTTAYLSNKDVLDGGSGSDTIKFLEVSTTSDITITSSQLAGLKNIETIELKQDASGATSQTKSLTLTDEVASNLGSSITIKAGAADTTTVANNMKLSIDASAVKGSDITIDKDGFRADTIKLGAGDDTVKLEDDDVMDILTLGSGKDTVDFSAYVDNDEGGVEIKITDFDFGTSNTYVDRLKLSQDPDSDGTNEFANYTIKKQSDGSFDPNNNSYVIVLDNAAYSDAASAEDAVVDLDSDNANDDSGCAFVFWQDTLGKVHLSYDADIDTDAGGLLDLAVFTNTSISDVAQNLDSSDLIFA